MGKHNWIAGVTALAMMGGLGACSRVSPQDLEAARQAGAAQAAQVAAAEKAKADKARLEKDVADLKKKAAEAEAKAKAGTSGSSGSTGGGSGGSAGSRNCGGNVTANSVTSCTFALSVASDWRSNGGGSTSFWSYSPVTNQSYWMRCSAGVVTVCRGGNNAAVYIR